MWHQQTRTSDGRMIVEAITMTADTIHIRIVKMDDAKPQTIGSNSNFRSMPLQDVLQDNALRIDGYSCIVQEVVM